MIMVPFDTHDWLNKGMAIASGGLLAAGVWGLGKALRKAAS